MKTETPVELELLADSIARARTFCDLQDCRRQLQHLIGIDDDEREAFRRQIAEREHQVIELYQTLEMR